MRCRYGEAALKALFDEALMQAPLMPGVKLPALPAELCSTAAATVRDEMRSIYMGYMYGIGVWDGGVLCVHCKLAY